LRSSVSVAAGLALIASPELEREMLPNPDTLSLRVERYWKPVPDPRLWTCHFAAFRDVGPKRCACVLHATLP
jgi:hypothetical protein